MGLLHRKFRSMGQTRIYTGLRMYLTKVPNLNFRDHNDLDIFIY